MWLTLGRASGRKNSAPILFINTPEEGLLYVKKSDPIGKKDYEPTMIDRGNVYPCTTLIVWMLY